MNYEKAINIFEKEFPKLTILKCVDYDEEHYVIEAVEDVDATDYNSPYYGVDKKTGKVTSFIPSMDLDAFFEAVENRTVFSTY